MVLIDQHKMKEERTMSNRREILDLELDNVTGGKITYTWDGNQGSIGINGNNNFVLVNKDAFMAYYLEVRDTMSEVDILRNLFAQNIITKP